MVSSYSSDFSFYIEDKPNLFDRNDKYQSSRSALGK